MTFKKFFTEQITDSIVILPGGFKPPHKGHFEAAKDLASRNYITQVQVIISPKERDGITAEESLAIWKLYLKAEPNPKITVKIADTVSPIRDIYDYIAEHPELDPVYVAGGKDEVDDLGYFKSLKKAFGDRVIPIPIDEKFGRISASYTRGLLRAGDVTGFKTTLPDSVIQKGYFDDIFGMLAPIIKENFEINSNNENSTIKKYLEEFADYCYGVLDLNNKPLIKDPNKIFVGFTVYVPDVSRDMASEPAPMAPQNVAPPATGDQMANGAGAAAPAAAQETGGDFPADI
jgi:hypothetical protein